MIYVGSPYTHPDRFVQEKRYLDVSIYTGYLMSKGNIAFSPIAHCHDIARYCKLPTDFEFWKHYCLSLLEKADAMVVLMLEGWEDSKGLTAEIKYAHSLGVPISYERMIHG